MGPSITIYTDGAARGNPGPGGYGIVLISGKHRKELSEGYRLTTNNRMELLAVIVALETLKKKNSNVTVYTDSRYVADAVEKQWVFEWERKGFKKKKNPDLWRRFLIVYRRHSVTFHWIKYRKMRYATVWQLRLLMALVCLRILAIKRKRGTHCFEFRITPSH